MQDRTTFQYNALDWLANEDAWAVDINSVPPEVFVERYVLALLFFSTNGPAWRQGLNFLEPTSVCEWSGQISNGIVINAVGQIPDNGVLCDGNVTALKMGTYGIKQGT